MQKLSRVMFASIFLLGAVVTFALRPQGWGNQEDGPQALAGGAHWVGLLESSDGDGFAPLSGAWRLELPDEHGAHPETRMETWSFAANLRDASGRDHGMQLVVSRVGIVPHSTAAGRRSPWALREFYRGHVVLVGPSDEASGSEERFRRGFPGIAGFDPAAGELRLDDWSAVFEEDHGSIRLRASAGAAARVELLVTPAKRAVSSAPGAGDGTLRGYSVPRMAVEGHIETAGQRMAVSGLGWLDHFWGELPLPGGPIASDRVQLHLDDGTDLTVIRTRRRDGGGTPTMQGLLVADDGTVTRLGGDALSMEPTRTWSGDDVSYPVDWRLHGPSLDIQVTAVADDQAQQFAEPIWSGAVVAEGRLNGEPVSGAGTLNLTGYAEK